MRIAVVMPTRERAATLRHALATCTRQDYEDLQIIVCDNASADETRDVVEAAADPRVRYVNPGRRVSMSANWEFALQHVDADFVTYVGDDDGLLPGAVTAAAGLLRDTGSPALGWLKGEYLWPESPKPELRNLLALPLADTLFEYRSRDLVRDACAFWVPYTRLPVLYSSFVSMDAVRAARSGGSFFHSVAPDVYSGLALASRLDRYLYSLRPFSLNGASGRSTGSSVLDMAKDAGADNATRTFLQENDLPLHPRFPVPYVGSVTAVVAESFLQANDHCWNGALDIDLRRVIRLAVREMAAADSRLYDAVAQQLRAATRGSRLAPVVERALSRYPSRPQPGGVPAPGLQPNGFLNLDAASFGVADVDAACTLAARVLGDFRFGSVRRRYTRFHKIGSRLLRRVSAAVPDPVL
jgi:hypothetical protein